MGKEIKGEEYQGWSSYETWAVALWISNDRGMYETVNEIVDQIVGDKLEESPDKDSRTQQEVDIADAIKAYIEEMKPELNGVWADLVNGALGEVDWFEIAQSQIR